MMELSFKSKCIKRKSKKKRISIPESALLPLVKPDTCDGISNWMRMQKIIGSVKEEKSKKEAKKKMLKIADINLNSNNYRIPHCEFFNSNRKKSAQGSPGKKLQLKVKIDQHNLTDECLNNKSPVECESETFQKNETQHYKFNFNGSNNSSNKDCTNELKQNKYGQKRLTKAVAMDCEMVGTGPKGEESIIARVSIVNSYGVCLYDEFVKPKERVTDFRTRISGVRPSDLKNGKDLFEVQKDVLKIIEGRILVGHSLKHDLDVLFMSHPRHLIRDTAFYKPFRDICGGKTPSLKKLTSKILGCDIQSGEHSSIEDAQAAMLLYLRQKQEWEREVRSQRKRKPKIIENRSKN